MIIDWNWFFGAFAQCAATLIAIIGAFIISKLLGESEKEEILNNKIDDLIIHYNDLKKRISIRHFSWYDKNILEYDNELIINSIKNGEFNELNDEEIMQKLLEIKPELFGTPNCLKTIKELISNFYPKRTKNIFEFPATSNLMIPIIPSSGLWDKLSEEKDLISQLNIESTTLIEQFIKGKNEIKIIKNNLIPIKITIFILCVGLILTVIYPLFFMPIEANQIPTIKFDYKSICLNLFSLKGFLLTTLTIVIEGIFVYFLLLLRSIENKYDNLLLKLKNDYFYIKAYSKYFQPRSSDHINTANL